MLSIQVYQLRDHSVFGASGLQIATTEKIRHKDQMRHTANEVLRSDYFAQMKSGRDIEKYRVLNDSMS